MKWYLDSGYSRHITRNRAWFRKPKPKDGGVVKFTDVIMSKIIGIGNVGKNNSNLITDIILVEGLLTTFCALVSFMTKAIRLCLNFRDAT